MQHSEDSLSLQAMKSVPTLCSAVVLIVVGKEVMEQ